MKHGIERLRIPEVWGRILFFAILTLSVILILSVPFYPSVDGAAHLYNAAIIRDLILDASSPYQIFYSINPVPVPNWLDHIILALLLIVFSAAWAQKVFLCLMIISFCFLFRRIVMKLNAENTMLSVLVFPFIFSWFFYIGLYNQQLSYILLLAFFSWTLTLGRFNYRGLNFYLSVLGFSLLLWSSNLITYVVFVAFFGLLLLLQLIKEKKGVRLFIAELFRAFIVLIPTIVLTIYFILNIQLSSGEEHFTIAKKALMLLQLRPLITFDYPGELRLLTPISIIFFLLGVRAFFNGKISEQLKSKSSIEPVRLLKLLTLIVLVVYFLVPNEAGAGMLTYRLAVIFYLLLLLIIVATPLRFKFQLLAALIVVGFQTGLTFKRHNGKIKKHAMVSAGLYEIGKHITPGSTVCPLQFSDGWFFGHSRDLGALANNAIFIENYEAHCGWFPVIWQSGKEKLGVEFYRNWENKAKWNPGPIPADYALLYGVSPDDTSMVSSNMLRHLHETSTLIHKSKEGDMFLYKTKN